MVFLSVRTMKELWNPKVAAERLVKFCENLLKGKIIKFKEGPCSKT